MPVYKGSRYEGVEYTSITGRDLVTRKYLHLRTPVKSTDIDQDWNQHTIQAGDVLDDLAYRYSGQSAKKAELWWLLADVNDLMWPLDLEPNQDLMIPTRELQQKGV